MPTMHIVSCRKNFWSPTEFSETDEIRAVNLDTGASQVVAPAVFLAAVAGKRLTVLVHGYNNEQLDVLDSYRTIDQRMRLLGFLGGAQSEYEALVGFAWPGGAVGISFPFARQRAGETAPRFQHLLTTLKASGATVDLNTHSLGAHVAFEALREAPPALVRIAWNFASAVDNESIESGERYFETTRNCAKFYVFHSKDDSVLRVWYRVGDFWDFDTALGYSGPEDPGVILANSPNVRVVNCKDVVHSHGGYRSAGQVWSFMAQELTSPTANQFITLRRTPEELTAVFRVAAPKPKNRTRVKPALPRTAARPPGGARPRAPK